MHTRILKGISIRNLFGILFTYVFFLRMGADQSTAKLALSECRIVVVGPRNGDNCMLELAKLPIEARILATGSSLEELQQDGNLFTEVTKTPKPLSFNPYF